MSIALFDAITGLNNFQRVLDTVGNNLANMSTPGYKRTSLEFKELLSQTLKGASSPGAGLGGTNPLQLGLGSSLGAVSTQFTQGLLETTGRTEDLAITGNGFFILKNDRGTGYTRNGGFAVDIKGNLVDSGGNLVQGWLADSTGAINTSGPLVGINIPIGISTIAKATTSAEYTGNLDASQAVWNPVTLTGGNYTTESIVYDSLGKQHTLSVNYKKAAPPAPPPTIDSMWNWTATIDGNAAGNGRACYLTDGSYDTTNSTANPTATFAVGGGAEDLSIALNFTKTTQLSSPGQYSLDLQSQNGCEAGTLQAFSIDKSGKIVGSFSNGMSQDVGQLAIATFTNNEGLERTEGSLMRETSNSGPPQVGAPGTGSRGQVNSKSLELSNVDMSTEFTKMIIAQRAFQANSRVVSVMDQILEEMANLKR